MEKWYERFHDAGFTAYNESGEAAAVYITRDLAEEVNTSGKWIDVISMNTFTHNSGRIGFNWIIVELFPRITNPDYTDDHDYNRYICWHAAHDDIAVHRSRNHHGEKYLVLAKLYVKETRTDTWGRTEQVYDYKVLASRPIKQKQIGFIQNNADSIVSQIRQKRKPILSMFHMV